MPIALVYIFIFNDIQQRPHYASIKILRLILLATFCHVVKRIMSVWKSYQINFYLFPPSNGSSTRFLTRLWFNYKSDVICVIEILFCRYDAKANSKYWLHIGTNNLFDEFDFLLIHADLIKWDNLLKNGEFFNVLLKFKFKLKFIQNFKNTLIFRPFIKDYSQHFMW